MNEESRLHDFVTNYSEVERSQFIRKTYSHVALALAGFVFIEILLFQSPYAYDLAVAMSGNWWVSLLLFMGATWLAEKMAMSSTSLVNQYAGLLLYVIAEAVIFVPLLMVVMSLTNSNELLAQAGTVTVALFVGLSSIVLTTKSDFNYLKTSLQVGGILAIGIILSGMLFGFDLGLLFSGFMVVLVAGSILYQTSNMMYRYNSQQYVAAALGLFAAFMTMLWYMIRIFSRD